MSRVVDRQTDREASEQVVRRRSEKREEAWCDYEVSNFGVVERGEGSARERNDVIGHLIRIKPVSMHEGGILAGVGSLCAWARE